MIEKLTIKKTTIILGALIFLGTIFTLYFIKDERGDTENKYSVSEISGVTEIPTYSLPLRYFSKNAIRWGSAGYGDDPYTWESAAVDGSRSYPTTTLSIDFETFSTSSEPLPSLKTLAEITETNKFETKDVFQEAFYNHAENQIKEYGNLAARFLSEGYDVTNVRKFDINMDGKDELIVSLCGTWGNHCPHEIIVIKDQKIIFSISTGSVGLELEKTDNGNGFYINWVPTTGDEWDYGLCCPPGYISTRFVYEDGNFKPVYEQEIRYIRVINTDQFDSE